MQFRNQELINFRATSPEQTLERISGALKRLELGEEHLLESPTSDRLHSARLTLPELRAGSNGKGTTKLQAKVSAYAEMVERLSTLETGLEISPYRLISMDRTHLAYQLKTYQHMKGYQWRHQDSHTRTLQIEELLRAIPFSEENFEYLKDNSKLLRSWISAYSLTKNKEIHIPPMFVRWISSSNGLASGNTIEESIIHAFCEILERYTLLHFIRGKERNFPNVDVNTIKDDDILSMLAYFERNNVEVIIKDLSSNGVFPAFAVITTSMDLSPKFVGYNTIKAGCHFDANEALKRAFTERMQGTSFNNEKRLGFIRGDETDVMLPLYFQGICSFDLKEYHSGDSVPMPSYTYTSTGEAYKKMELITSVLSSEMIVVDHTHPVMDFPVVRLIMPGISDFIGWWSTEKLTINFMGNIIPEDEKYEDNLFRFLSTFKERQKCLKG
jgi:YcaO-like protein with predicted kinase domain